jgi:hypothetical protein
MKEQYIDTFIYVKDANKQSKQLDVIGIIKGIAGVVKASQHSRLTNVVEVSYNAQGVDASQIVYAANQKGCNVVSVGL